MNSLVFSKSSLRTRSPKEVEQLLLEDPLALVSCFSELASADYDDLGESIGHIFSMNRRSADLLTLCATEEIYSTARGEQLLRQDSIYIVIMQHFVKSRGRNWLYRTLRKPLRKIIQNEFCSIEIDKLRVATNEDIATNRNNLEETIRSVLDPIFSHPELIPAEIGAMCRVLFQLTNERFPGKGYAVLSASLFLRFICPFIGSPKSWHLLTRQEVNPETRRKLILVTKVVQGIANENTQFNETYMNQIHDLLEEYIQKLHVFYDQLMQISPTLHQVSPSPPKEKKNQLTVSVTHVRTFFLNKFDSIIQRIVQPLSDVYDEAQLFGQRLELCLYDDLPAEQRYFTAQSTRDTLFRETMAQLKEVRRVKGRNLWGSLMEELRESVSAHLSSSDSLSSYKLSQLHFMVLPRQLYNIDNNNDALGINSQKGFRRRIFSGRKARPKLRKASQSVVHEPEAPPIERSDSRLSLRSLQEEESLTDYSDGLTEAFENEEDTALYQWLENLGYDEYYGLFTAFGVREVHDLSELTEQMLTDMQITHPTTVQQLLAAAAFLSPRAIASSKNSNSQLPNLSLHRAPAGSVVERKKKRRVPTPVKKEIPD